MLLFSSSPVFSLESTQVKTHARARRGSLIGRRLQSTFLLETEECTYELDLRFVRRGEGAGLTEIKECKR